MPAGSRRYLITIQNKTLTDDQSGQPIETWSYFCNAYADVEATGGSERFRGHQIVANMTHVIEVIADSVTRKITPGMRVLWRGREINLVVVRPLEGKMRTIQLQGQEVVQQ